MKTILKLSALILLTSFIFSDCKKDETKLYYTGGTAPTLATKPATDTLSYLNEDKTVLTLNWTNPDYSFTTGVSSLDVTYNLQVDTVGANFSNPYIVTVSKDLSYSFVSSVLNDIMQNQLNLKPGVKHVLEMRVISNLTNNSAQLTSNTVQYNATPYIIPPKVQPPFTGKLFLIGSALTGNSDGWNNPVNASKFQFAQTDNLHYTLTTTLYGGEEYLFIPDNGSWSNKYACTKESAQAVTGGDFGYNLSDNFPSPAATGIYKIDVDFQKGKYTVTKQ